MPPCCDTTIQRTMHTFIPQLFSTLIINHVNVLIQQNAVLGQKLHLGYELRTAKTVSNVIYLGH